MHSLGNDFVIFQNAPKLSVSHIQHIANRRTGVGCDQVINIRQKQGQTSSCDLPILEIWNQDGSQAEACGNGTRCVIWLLSETMNSVRLEGPSGQLWGYRTSIGGAEVEAFHAEPKFEANLDLSAWGLAEGTPAFLGNPHLVVWLKTFQDFDLSYLGAQLECHSFFPSRTNVSFAVIEKQGCILLKTWERGVGLTPACGSAACVVGSLIAPKGGGPVRVKMEQGALDIRYHLSGEVSHKGPVAFSFEGSWPYF